MAVDTRWPVIPLFILRGVQFIFALIVLGLQGYYINLVSSYSLQQGWAANMSLVAALFTILYIVINIVLFFVGLLLPLAIVIVDAFLFILWLVALSGVGADLSNSGVFNVQCSSFSWYSNDLETACGVLKASFSFSLFSFVLFIGTIVIASIVLDKNRKDLRGAKYNSGLAPNGEAIDMERHGGPGVVPAAAQGSYQEAKPTYYQQQQPQFQQQQADGYYPQQAQSIVSPPQTPAPYVQQQGYENAVSPPPPPPPPPVNVQEMPGYR